MSSRKLELADMPLPPVVARFMPDRIRASTAAGRISRVISESIRDSAKSREEIAREMSACLGETITVAMLDQYSSTANEKNNMPAHRLVALLSVTSDVRIVNALLADTGFIAVDGKYEALIRRETLREHQHQVQQQIEAADLQWRTSR